MPTIVHCHTGRRLMALATGWAIALFALGACSVADHEYAAVTSGARAVSGVVGGVGRVDPDYFPSQFPAPTGDVQPLPPQF